MLDLNVKNVQISDLIPYARNARTHSDEQIRRLAGSILEFGFVNPVLIDGNKGIIAGHGRVLAAEKVGMTEVPTIELSHLSEAQRKAYVIADNQHALNAGWDTDLLKLEVTDLEEVDFDLGALGFDDDFLADLTINGTEGLTDPDSVPDVPDDAVTVKGDVWVCGCHKIRCGSSSDEGLGPYYGDIDLVLTDPPYCSGGFQEAGKASGSVGRRSVEKQIANDRLSSRGFGNLIRSSVFSIDAPFFYVFTDWRMWVYLFDIAESSSAGVKSMIAWDKGCPGMGVGWRAQHELVMWATRKAPPYAKGFGGVGNVIKCSRQKNEFHTTQKPVEVIVALLQGAPFARTVAEPFCGSGTTIIACEMEGRSCRACELDSQYVDVAVKRWQEFTGQQATLEGDGRTFDEVGQERGVEHGQL